MQVKHTLNWLLLVFSCLTGCSQDKQTYALFEKPTYNFLYQLAEPNKSWILPKALVEISGLSFIDNNRLACVQDEKGNIYIFNLKAGAVELKIKFGDNGDYEGIEIIEDDAWVLKSNGTLYKVTDYLNIPKPKVKKHKTALSVKNDAEGLAYDPVKKNLLIACKEQPFLDDRKGNDYKAIYSINLETKQIDPEPFLLINMDTIKYYRSDNTMTRLGAEIQDFLDPSKGDVRFKPSGIAIHPLTGNIFILGSVGKLMLVLSRKGEILAIIRLSSMLFPQPEGMCFSPDGNLYIANEGAGQEGTILKFEPIK